MIGLCISLANSQSIQRSVLGMSGASKVVNSSGKTYLISQSIGQNGITGTATRNGFSVRQGFQQPPYKFEAGLQTNELKLKVYPNPTEHQVSIYIEEEDTAEIVLISIIDRSGRILISDRFEESRSFEVDVSALAAGAYILKAQAGSKQFITKLIKQ